MLKKVKIILCTLLVVSFCGNIFLFTKTESADYTAKKQEYEILQKEYKAVAEEKNSKNSEFDNLHNEYGEIQKTFAAYKEKNSVVINTIAEDEQMRELMSEKMDFLNAWGLFSVPELLNNYDRKASQTMEKESAVLNTVKSFLPFNLLGEALVSSREYSHNSLYQNYIDTSTFFNENMLPVIEQVKDASLKIRSKTRLYETLSASNQSPYYKQDLYALIQSNEEKYTKGDIEDMTRILKELKLWLQCQYELYSLLLEDSEDNSSFLADIEMEMGGMDFLFSDYEEEVKSVSLEDDLVNTIFEKNILFYKKISDGITATANYPASVREVTKGAEKNGGYKKYLYYKNGVLFKVQEAEQIGSKLANAYYYNLAGDLICVDSSSKTIIFLEGQLLTDDVSWEEASAVIEKGEDYYQQYFSN